jgi:hypothetical protein
VCPECGGTFELSTRRARERRDAQPRCRPCRRPRVELTTAERQRFGHWWLEESGLSKTALHEIAVGLSVPE